MNCFLTFSCTYKLPNGSDGGYFNAIMSFPSNYPNSPPTVKFISKIWHPNVYTDGLVCISILHPPGEDPNGYELASERWSPVHTVESIVLSIISMLSSPNDESPANIEAAVKLKLNLFTWVDNLLTHDQISRAQNGKFIKSFGGFKPVVWAGRKEWRERRDDFKKKVSRCVRRTQEMF
ncbi:hypothetical protein TEA_006082 [Camellia sinensis var. sinensis]|uniref:UBC core domain-containing protein n=1 Tax=Camellia sinensis var. sinensis TaxID=542762 RepID=A0A4S4DGN1_CAMSN|nr:hypothetical protein TEA_006082 [Camellia sinensis var. sinensis]